MQDNHRSMYKLISLITGLVLLFSAIGLAAAGAAPSRLPAAQDDGLRRGRDPQTGLLTFLGADPSNPVRVPGAMRAGMRAEDRAASVLGVYGPEFGLQDPARELVVKHTTRPARGRQTVRFQQMYQGIPVLGGELIVNSKDDGALLSINGEISPGLTISTRARISAATARGAALGLMKRNYQTEASAVTLTKPELWVYDEHLLRSELRGSVKLAWRMEASIAGQPVRELVLVGAQDGNILLHFNQVDTSWTGAKPSQPEGAVSRPAAPRNLLIGGSPHVSTYDAAHNWYYLPGTFLCNESDPTCTGYLFAQKAHEYALGVYDFYWNTHGRDSINGYGMTIVSTVRYGVKYANAFWNGYQMVYGDGYGFSKADDVVGHELSHGVTDYESNLFYYYQSGAINESFSDLWGEAFDQDNGQGNDSDAVKWLMGEDVTGLGAIRSMKNPPLYGDPDKMKSSKYYKGSYDNGGVHTNSGVNNKAAYLMVEGGTFNKKTVAALGWDKVLTIYYEAQTNLLTSGADYLDLHHALYQACLNKIGSEGIVPEDCPQVQNATLAVQMNQQPAANYNPDPGATCPAGMTYDTELYYEDFEFGASGWTLQTPTWDLTTGYAASGTQMIFGTDDRPKTNRSAYSGSFALPPDTKPFLHFKHAFGFEYWIFSGHTYYFDGGVLEYTVNNGVTWKDAGPLFNAGRGYGGTIASYSGSGNPLQGRRAFVGDSHGYVGSRYNLSSLAGKNVQFRWRLGTDEYYDNLGWVIDDVSIFTCMPNPSKPLLLSPANGAGVTIYTPTLDWGDSTPSLNHYQLQVSTDKTFATTLIDDNSLLVSEYTPPADLEIGQTFYWRVQAFNSLGGTNGWSRIFSFKTIPVQPVLVSPTGGVVPLDKRPTFDWDDVPGATSYTIQADLTKPLASPFVINKTVAASEFTPTADLPSNKVLYWRVRANSPAGNSKWSLIANFKSANPPSVPILKLPANGSTGTDLKPVFDWSTSSLPAGTVFDHYQIQISTDSSFVAVDVDENIAGRTNSTYMPLADLATGVYSWRVRAFNTLGQYSSWSPVFTVTIATP